MLKLMLAGLASNYSTGTPTNFRVCARRKVPAKRLVKNEKSNFVFSYTCLLGVKFRNTKMDLNIYGNWCRVMFEKLMKKI